MTETKCDKCGAVIVGRHADASLRFVGGEADDAVYVGVSSVDLCLDCLPPSDILGPADTWEKKAEAILYSKFLK